MDAPSAGDSRVTQKQAIILREIPQHLQLHQQQLQTPSMAADSGAPAHHHSADSLWKLLVSTALAAEKA